jgi:uncharacterized protein (DUF305 family)
MTTMLRTIAIVTSLMAAPALAQQNHGPGHGPPRSTAPAPGGHQGHGAMNTQSMTPAAKAFAEANAKMHKDMTIPFSGNADVDFARGMIPHHQGAIDMAEIVLKHGSDATVKKLATEIIAAQRKEIAQLQGWLQMNASLSAGPDSASVAKAFTDANAKMHKDMMMTFSGKADIDFMKGMIPHHEGAVDMAKVQMQFGKDPELRKLADDVVRTQNEEITRMRDWLKKNGA